MQEVPAFVCREVAVMVSAQQQQSEEKKSDRERFIKLLGLRIERRTDIAAIAAFLLSMIVVSWEVVMYFQGPRVKVVPSESVTFFANFCEERNKFLEVLRSTAYVNAARVGYNDVVLDEKVHLKFPRRWEIAPVQLHAGRVVRQTDNDLEPGVSFCTERESQSYYPGITIENAEEEVVAPVQGGSVLARTVQFFTDSKMCGADWEDCKVQSKGVELDEFLTSAREGDKVEVEFHARLLVVGNKVERCVVKLTKDMLRHLAYNQYLSTDCSTLE